jgi:hypothetical protein
MAGAKGRSQVIMVTLPIAIGVRNAALAGSTRLSRDLLARAADVVVTW